MTRRRNPLALLAAAILTAALISACGGNSAKHNAALKAERNAAIRHAHAKFSIAPCSLLSVTRVSAVLGVHAHTQTARAGCVYTGTAHGDQRTLTVTPGAKPASGELISAAIKHPVAVSGAGYHGEAGSTPTPGDVSVPTSAVAGIVAGNAFVSLLVQDANPNAPSQVGRVLTLAREAGKHLAASGH
jgi:hypothetical protein